MVSSRSSRKTNKDTNKDFISNVPDIVTDKILELLPIQTAARMSVLSKQWRRNWLSLKRLNFDDEFCFEHRNCNWQECSNIISSILFHHDGPVHDFNLLIPEDTDEENVNLSQWLSFLSKNKVTQINLNTCFDNSIPVSSYMFFCSELVALQLDGGFALNHPPEGFNGFPKLKHLVLNNVKFNQEESFRRLVTKCRMLATLRLEHWTDMKNIVLDVPSLETLTIIGYFESLAFKDVRNLKSVSVNLWEIEGKPLTIETIRAFNFLANSCQLQCIEFGGNLCKFLSASGIRRRLPTAFKHLTKLCLEDLDLGDPRVLQYVYDMVESSPNIKDLSISVIRSENATQHKINCNTKHKMNNLVQVKFDGITGSSAEVKLIEYLLAISGVLGKLEYKCGELDIESELKLSRKLLGFPRASAKARIVCLI